MIRAMCTLPLPRHSPPTHEPSLRTLAPASACADPGAAQVQPCLPSSSMPYFTPHASAHVPSQRQQVSNMKTSAASHSVQVTKQPCSSKTPCGDAPRMRLPASEVRRLPCLLRLPPCSVQNGRQKPCTSVPKSGQRRLARQTLAWEARRAQGTMKSYCNLYLLAQVDLFAHGLRAVVDKRVHDAGDGEHATHDCAYICQEVQERHALLAIPHLCIARGMNTLAKTYGSPDNKENAQLDEQQICQWNETAQGEQRRCCLITI